MAQVLGRVARTRTARAERIGLGELGRRACQSQSGLNQAVGELARPGSPSLLAFALTGRLLLDLQCRAHIRLVALSADGFVLGLKLIRA